MGIDPTLLLRLLAASVVVGMALGLVYDVLRICRVMMGMSRYTAAASAPIFCPHFCRPRRTEGRSRVSDFVKRAVLIAQDFFFCVTFGIAVALLLFSRNGGEFRGFVLLGALLGFAAYYFTVGQLVIRASEYVVFAIRTALLYAVYYVTLPFIAVVRFIGRHVMNMVKARVAKRREKRIVRYTKAEEQSLIRLAENGFLCDGILSQETK